MDSNPKTIELAGREIARVGLGTNRLTDTDENREFLHAAAEAGVGHIDTAHLYKDGASETTIGNTFPGGSERPLIATKAGFETNEPEALRGEIEQSFERLQADSIDLLYLHRPNDDAPFGATVELLASYVEDGRVDALGLSEVSVEQLDEARAITPIAAVQNEFHLEERKHDEVLDHCAAEGIAFVPFFPLRGDHPEVAAIAGERGLTENTVKIAWLLARSSAMVPIPGTLSIEHLRENLAALEVELSEGELDRLTG